MGCGAAPTHLWPLSICIDDVVKMDNGGVHDLRGTSEGELGWPFSNRRVARLILDSPMKELLLQPLLPLGAVAAMLNWCYHLEPVQLSTIRQTYQKVFVRMGGGSFLQNRFHYSILMTAVE